MKTSEILNSSSIKTKGFLTIEQKINLLNDWVNQDNKVTKASLATKYMIDESSVRGIIKSEDQIRESHTQMGSKASNRYKLNISRFPELDEALILWFYQAREKGTPVSGDMILNQAKFYNPQIQEELSKRCNISYKLLRKRYLKIKQ